MMYYSTSQLAMIFGIASADGSFPRLTDSFLDLVVRVSPSGGDIAKEQAKTRGLELVANLCVFADCGMKAPREYGLYPQEFYLEVVYGNAMNELSRYVGLRGSELVGRVYRPNTPEIDIFSIPLGKGQSQIVMSNPRDEKIRKAI